MASDGPWLGQCERAALFARQFYEREGKYFPTLDVLARDGTRHVFQFETCELAAFLGVRKQLGPALAWCYAVLGSVVDKKESVDEQYRCLMVLGRDIGGGWYGKLWPAFEGGKLGEVKPIADSRVAMDILLLKVVPSGGTNG